MWMGKWQLRLLSFFIFAGVWQILAAHLDSLLFPSFTETVSAFAQLVFTPEFWQALWTSHQALVLGYLGAVLFGILCGLLMGRSRTIAHALDPYMSILLATPKAAIIPIVIMAFGLGLPARAFVVFLFAVVVIVVNTHRGIRTLDTSWIEMADVFGANEFQLWRRILIPGALPSIMTGLQLGLGRAFTGMIAVELLLVAVGLGRLILKYQGHFEAGAVYATVGFVVLEAVVLLGLVKRLDARFTHQTNPLESDV
jgi:NitT/TauT family transport system permease protein